MTSIKKEEDNVDNYLLRELAIRLWLQDVLFEDLTTRGGSGRRDNRPEPSPRKNSAPPPPGKAGGPPLATDDEDGPYGDVPLSELLKDGVRLCRLMLAIIPRSIPVIHRGREAHRLPFKKKANISFFLAACEESGISLHESFLIDDLYEERNMLKVVECIEHLGDVAYDNGFYFVLKTPEEAYQGELERLVGKDKAKSMPVQEGLRMLFSDEDRRRGKVILERGRPKKRATLTFLSAEQIASFDEEEADIAQRFYGSGGPPPSAVPASPDARSRSIALGRSKKPSLASFFLEKNSLPSATLRRGHGPPPAPPVKHAGHPPLSYQPAPTPTPVPAPTAMVEEEPQLDEQEDLLQEEEHFLKCVVRCQAIARGWAARRQFKERLRNAEYRKNVAQEIYHTEKDYVRSLEVLQNVFLQTMCNWEEENVKVIETKALQSDIRVIYGYNSQLLQDLKPRVKNWTPHQFLGDIFVKVATFLRVYTQFVADYGKAMREVFENRKKSRRFDDFMNNPMNYCQDPEKYRARMGGLLFSSFVIQPVQRIPRYVLLLQELARRTEPDHKDLDNLLKAATSIGDVAKYVEQKAAEAENSNKVLDIQSRLVGNPHESLVQPNRKFVREGVLMTEKFAKLGVSLQAKRAVFLFNNLLLVAKPQKTMGQEDDSVLKYVKSTDITLLSPISVPDVVGKETKRNCICLINDQRETEYMFYCASKLEKREWLKDLLAVKFSAELQTKNHKEVLKKYSRLSTVDVMASNGQPLKEAGRPSPLGMGNKPPRPKPPAHYPQPPHQHQRIVPKGGSPRDTKGNQPANKQQQQFSLSTKKLSKLLGVDEKIVEKAQQKPSLPSMLRRMYSNVDSRLKRPQDPIPARGPGSRPQHPIHQNSLSNVRGLGQQRVQVSNPIQRSTSIPHLPKQAADEEDVQEYLNPLLEMLLNCIDIQENSLNPDGRPTSIATPHPKPSGGMSNSMESLPPYNPTNDGAHENKLPPKTTENLAVRRPVSPKGKGPPPAPPASGNHQHNPAPPINSSNNPPSARIPSPRGQIQTPPAASSPPTAGGSPGNAHRASPPMSTTPPAGAGSGIGQSGAPQRPPRPRGGSGITRPSGSPNSSSPLQPDDQDVAPSSPARTHRATAAPAPLRPARPGREDPPFNNPKQKDARGGPPPVPIRSNKPGNN